MYSYVENNPINFVDPEGLIAQPGDDSLYPPTHNCSCTINCKADPKFQYSYFGRICSKIGNKLIGAKPPWSIPIGIGLREACQNYEKGLVCSFRCDDFCSGKKNCTNPYPDK